MNNFKHIHPSDYKGLRQDSGDPYEFTEKVLRFYKYMDIDPKTKYIVYSDGLDVDKIIDLHNKYNDKINVSFGWGTNLTNDCGFTAPNIVIKMTECMYAPVAKLSDSPGKTMCDNQDYVNYLKRIFK